MRKLFKDLTTEENIINFGKALLIFIVVLCAVIFIRVLTHPELISLPNIK